MGRRRSGEREGVRGKEGGRRETWWMEEEKQRFCGCPPRGLGCHLDGGITGRRVEEQGGEIMLRRGSVTFHYTTPPTVCLISFAAACLHCGKHVLYGFMFLLHACFCPSLSACLCVLPYLSVYPSNHPSIYLSIYIYTYLIYL